MLPFAVIEGNENPDSEDVIKAIDYLLDVIEPIKKKAKEIMGKSFIEASLEMLYWADDMNNIISGNKNLWKWNIMITLPVWIDDELFNKSVEEANEKLSTTLFHPILDFFS